MTEKKEKGQKEAKKETQKPSNERKDTGLKKPKDYFD